MTAEINVGHEEMNRGEVEARDVWVEKVQEVQMTGDCTINISKGTYYEAYNVG